MKKLVYLLVTALLVLSVVGCMGSSSGTDTGTETETEQPYPNSSPVEDFEYEDCDGGVMITHYVGDGGEVVIPEEIDGKAVKEIGMYAFSQNRNVTAVTFPPSMEVINGGAFYYANRLQKVTLNEGLKKIGNGAFESCGSLMEITLPSTLTDLGMNAFYKCVILKHINIPRSLQVKNNDYAGDWGHASFAGTGIKTVEFEEGVTAIPSSAFAGAPLSEVVLPSSMKVIYSYAFGGCDDLTVVKLNDGLEKIDVGAFSGTVNLTEIVIPSSVKSVDETAFSKCENLEKVVFEGDAPELLRDEERDEETKVNYTVYNSEDAVGFDGEEWSIFDVAVK